LARAWGLSECTHQRQMGDTQMAHDGIFFVPPVESATSAWATEVYAQQQRADGLVGECAIIGSSVSRVRGLRRRDGSVWEIGY